MTLKKLLFWRTIATLRADVAEMQEVTDRLKSAITVLADTVDTQGQQIKKLAADFYTVEKNTGNVPAMEFDAHGDV